ncbi:MAG: RAD55 family ATPase [Candidatus Thermoplasmatota archaeon]|jgi:KaiC/GvpD/RAD55 family RecA-like ATPase|nr:RAD55 family ATPase [Candidatus Thermoplasmatota archaeon]
MASLSIGIPKVDRILIDGGVPAGFTILVKGAPGAGMDLFAKQFTSGAETLESVLYISTDERLEDVIRVIKQYGWSTNLDILDIASSYFDRVLARELEISKLKRDGLTVSDLLRLIDASRSEEREETNFLRDVSYTISDMSPPFRVVVDSLDFFLENYSPSKVISAMRTIKAHTYYNKGLALITLTADMHDRKTENALDAIADIVIEMNLITVGTEYETRLIIRKVRNYPGKAAIMTYSITPEKGITPEVISRVA